MKHEITMTEVRKIVENGICTFTKKDDSPRGCKTVYFEEIKIGDKILIDNYFHEIIE